MKICFSEDSNKFGGGQVEKFQLDMKSMQEIF